MLTLLQGDCRETLRGLPSESVNCCVTSPPYFNLRDYGNAAQIGLEQTPAAYVAEIVSVFREVRRVLRPDGTLWANLGDSYAMLAIGSSGKGERQARNAGSLLTNRRWSIPEGIKPKDLLGIPWAVAFALRADGWYLRSDIIWHKKNPMPESVTDRPTKSHEYLFLLSKSQRYFYDAAAIAEGFSSKTEWTYPQPDKAAKSGFTTNGTGASGLRARPSDRDTRNKRTVWTIGTQPYADAHFATYPPDLIKPCILAGCPVGGTVLDPFGGSGTTGQVAIELGRKAVLCELNPAYCELIRQRCDVTPGLPLGNAA